jgi:hypothetical protein
MTGRLRRIQVLVLALTSALTVVAFCSGISRPLGIVLGGGAAWLDFVVIRTLAAVMFDRNPSIRYVVPMAFVKSIALLAVPAAALLLPRSVIDGVSFGLGVTALPAAIVLDALLPSGRASLPGEA